MDKVIQAVYNDVHSINRNIWLCSNPTDQLKRNYVSATYLIVKIWRRDLGLPELPTPLKHTPYNAELLECWDKDSEGYRYVEAIRHVRAAMHTSNLPRKPRLGL